MSGAGELIWLRFVMQLLREDAAIDQMRAKA